MKTKTSYDSLPHGKKQMIRDNLNHIAENMKKQEELFTDAFIRPSREVRDIIRRTLKNEFPIEYAMNYIKRNSEYIRKLRLQLGEKNEEQ